MGSNCTWDFCQLLGSMSLVVPITMGVVRRVRVHGLSRFPVRGSGVTDGVSKLSKIPDKTTELLVPANFRPFIINICR